MALTCIHCGFESDELVEGSECPRAAEHLLGWFEASGSMNIPWYPEPNNSCSSCEPLRKALDKIWLIVRTYDTRPDVSIRVLQVLEGLG
jgi:hypothetical protein